MGKREQSEDLDVVDAILVTLEKTELDSDNGVVSEDVTETLRRRLLGTQE
jgi:L-cysteine desulfidase